MKKQILIIIFVVITIGLGAFFNNKILKIKSNNIYALDKNNIRCTYKRIPSKNDNEESRYILEFSSENGIQKIEYNNTIINCNSKTKVGVDLKVEKDQEKIVTVTTVERKSR